MKKLLKYTVFVVALSAIIVFSIIGVTEANEAKKFESGMRVGYFTEIEDEYTILKTEFVFDHLGHVYYTNDVGDSGKLTFIYQEFEDYIRFPKKENDMEVVEKIRDQAEIEIRKILPKNIDSLNDEEE